jgi:integrase
MERAVLKIGGVPYVRIVVWLVLHRRRRFRATFGPRTTVTRRLCTIAVFYKYAVEEELLKVVTIPLAPRTARAIDLTVGERACGPLFLAADERRLDRHGTARIVRRVTRRAGISKHVSPHTLRHAFITAALDAGVPLRDVQEAASHADPRTTMRCIRRGDSRAVVGTQLLRQVRGVSRQRFDNALSVKPPNSA